MCEDEYWERHAGRNGKNQGHSENAAHGMRTSLYMKTVIYSWMVKWGDRKKEQGPIEELYESNL